MTWLYEQSTGALSRDDDPVATGYAGKGEGKNNPEMQDVQKVGPLPRGVYSIGEPHDTEAHGPYVLRLTPDPNNQMFDRAGFLIHGDSASHPGDASEGCMIFPLNIRKKVWTSGDHDLEVVA